ncbi:MAG: CDP-alcohol phosphatidyltransferase family protein [Proteobacteria bacterium]|jgi:phosphatidylglycerophosphate synthase|nr:CDP-alcohol phosphatidyltransferase family protein [Pseudomonadota bacterium]
MGTSWKTAIAICPAGPAAGTVGRKLLGLDIGERLLLALAHAGVERVLCVGPGERPRCARAAIRVDELKPGSLAVRERAVLLPADLVFDRRLVEAKGALPADLPLREVTAASVGGLLALPEEHLDRLGVGSTGGAGKGFAVRVTDPSSARGAERSLLASLRKPTDGIVSRLLNRRISLAVTRLVVRTRLRPNHLTIMLMALGPLAFAAAAFTGSWWGLVLAGLLYQAHSVLDGCDGEIARLTYRFSRTGQWLDSIGDALANYLFCLGLAFGQAHAHGWTWLYVAGALLFAIQCHASGINIRRGARMGSGDLLSVPNALTGGPPRGALGRFARGFHAAARRDVYALMTAVLAAAQLPLVALGVFAVGSVVLACAMTLNEWRLRALEREGRALPDPAMPVSIGGRELGRAA